MHATDAAAPHMLQHSGDRDLARIYMGINPQPPGETGIALLVQQGQNATGADLAGQKAGENVDPVIIGQRNHDVSFTDSGFIQNRMIKRITIQHKNPFRCFCNGLRAFLIMLDQLDARLGVSLLKFARHIKPDISAPCDDNALPGISS